jgi:hypothetical protein
MPMIPVVTLRTPELFFAAVQGNTTNVLTNLENTLRDVQSNPDTSAAKVGLLQLLLSGLKPKY